MREIQTNGITILFVEVPEDAIFLKIEYDGLIAYNDLDSEMPDFINIPFGNYQILGKSTELSEELQECIVERKCPYSGLVVFKYRNYLTNRFEFDTSKESYLSLLEANGIVDRCLIDKPNEADILEDCGDLVYARAKYQSLLEQYQEAQSKVKTYLVLKRI